EARIDLRGRHRQAPAAVLGGEGTQHPAVLVLDEDGEVAEAREIGGKEAIEQERCAREQHQDTRRGGQETPSALEGWGSDHSETNSAETRRQIPQSRGPGKAATFPGGFSAAFSAPFLLLAILH